MTTADYADVTTCCLARRPLLLRIFDLQLVQWMNLARVVAEIEPKLVSLVLVTRHKENLSPVR